MKVYIAGPMSGIAEHNFPAFFRAEARLLRDDGWDRDPNNRLEIVNPARINAHLPHGLDWHVYLRNDIKQLADCDAIYLLRGWHDSRGATLEFEIARRLGMKIHFEG